MIELPCLSSGGMCRSESGAGPDLVYDGGMKRKRPALAAVRLRVQRLEARVLGKLGICDMEAENMPAAKGLDHEAILRDRMAGMTRSQLGQKYGVAKSTIAWHLRRNGNGNGETPQEAAAAVTLFHRSADVTLPANGHVVEKPSSDTKVLPANGHAEKKLHRATSIIKSGAEIESPTNGRARAAGGDLAELESLLDEHWRLLSVTERVRCLLNTYAC